jgi:hypothetical protein
LYLALSVIGIPRTPVWFWGLPDWSHYFSYHPDEIFLLVPSFGFAAGDWNPHFFNYGTLYIYLVGIPAVALGHVADPARFPADLRPLYEMGRTVTALLGAATVVALYLALRREGRAAAVLAVVLLALCPLHIVNSGYATVDVPATVWVVVAFWLALWGSDRPDAKRGALVGLAVGLGAATKYNAGLFIVPAMLAPLVARPVKWTWGWLAGGVAGAVAGFMIGCPFFWTEEFLRGVVFEAKHAAAGGTLAFAGTGPGWAYHLTHGLPVGLGYPLLAAAALGAAVAVVLSSRSLRLSLVWVLFYMLVIGFSKEWFIRYLVPITPFLCVLAAGPFLWLGSLPGRRWAPGLAVALAGGVVALTGMYASGQSERFVGDDPRDRAWEQISSVVSDGGRDPSASSGQTGGAPRVGLVQVPWYLHPPVSPYNAGPFSKPWFEKWNQETGSTVVVIGWDAGKVMSERPDVFFLSDLESQDLVRLGNQQAIGLIAALDGVYEKKTLFARPPPRFPWLAPPRAWAPPDWLYPDPHITMYYRPRPKDQ